MKRIIHCSTNSILEICVQEILKYSQLAAFCHARSKYLNYNENDKYELFKVIVIVLITFYLVVNQ